MRRRRSPTLFVATVVAVATLSGCATDQPGPEEVAASEAMERRFEACARLGDDVTATLQQYVDQFEVAEPGPEAGPAVPSLSIDELQAAAQDFAQRRTGIGCGTREFQVILARAITDLDGTGPYAAAVAARLRDEVLPVDGPPQTVTVAPGDDLVAAVHDAQDGAMIRLRGGTHELDEPLVLLRATSLVAVDGAEVVVRSTAPGTAVLHGGGGTLHVDGITFEHAGDQPASVLVIAGGGHDLRDVTVRGGVADAAGTTGWGLVLAGPDVGGDPRDVVGLRAIGNEAGGLVVAGTRAPRLEDVRASDNDRCGLCWLEAAAGTLTNAVSTANEIGVSVAGTASPELVGAVVSDNTGLGILVEGAGAPRLEDVELRDNGAIGVAVRGAARPAIVGVLATGHGEAGVVVEGSAVPVIDGGRVTGSPVGLFVRGDAEARIDGTAVDDVTDASIVLGGDSTGTVAMVNCDPAVFGIVLLDATTVDVTTSGCDVTDQRGS